MAVLRLCRLDPEYHFRYPDLPAGQWMPAWEAAVRRADQVWWEAGADALSRGRVLPEDHFQFRGGEPRPVGWYPTPERLSDPSPAELRQAEKVGADQ
jgi:hypothetical protein